VRGDAAHGVADPVEGRSGAFERAEKAAVGGGPRARRHQPCHVALKQVEVGGVIIEQVAAMKWVRSRASEHRDRTGQAWASERVGGGQPSAGSGGSTRCKMPRSLEVASPWPWGDVAIVTQARAGSGSARGAWVWTRGQHLGRAGGDARAGER